MFEAKGQVFSFDVEDELPSGSVPLGLVQPDQKLEQNCIPQKVSKKVNVLLTLRSTKCRMVKFGNSGFTGLRRINITMSNDRLEWDSMDKGGSSIGLEEIDEIVYGQVCENFHKRHAPRDMALVSFSLMHNGTSLDLMAPSWEDFELWTEGLSQLIPRVKAEKFGMMKLDDQPVEKLKELWVSVPQPKESDRKDIAANLNFYLSTHMYE